MSVFSSKNGPTGWCHALCWILLAVVPPVLQGQAPGAILHTEGGVWVNGYEAHDSTAIFSGDLIESKPGFAANLALDGSEVQIQAETVAKFQGDLLVLDHGSVAVSTSRSFRVRVNCITVTPVQNEWTQYEVTDVNGSVRVAARKLDVNVSRESKDKKPSPENAATNSGTVHESEEKTFDESAVCGAAAAPAHPLSSLNPKWIAAAAGGGGGILICVLLCSGGGGKHNLSQSTP